MWSYFEESVREYHSVLKFTLPNTTGTISDIKLKLYAYDVVGSPESVLAIQETDWDEGTATWNSPWTSPGGDISTEISRNTEETTDEYHTFDIMDGATNPQELNWGDDINLIIYESEETGTHGHQWETKEYTNPPYLEITYTTGSSTPTTTISTSTWTSQDIKIINTCAILGVILLCADFLRRLFAKRKV